MCLGSGVSELVQWSGADWYMLPCLTTDHPREGDPYTYVLLLAQVAEVTEEGGRGGDGESNDREKVRCYGNHQPVVEGTSSAITVSNF